jgi:hypothetical protein
MKAQPVKRKKIILSDRSPVAINPKEWPVIVEVWDHDGTFLTDAHTIYSIAIRQHSDGRRIVYGSRKVGPGGQTPDFRPINWGKILQSSESLTHYTLVCIGDCAEAIRCPALGQSAIQSLPAEEL